MTDTQEIYKNLTSPRTVYVVMRKRYNNNHDGPIIVEGFLAFFDKEKAQQYIDKIEGERKKLFSFKTQIPNNYNSLVDNTYWENRKIISKTLDLDDFTFLRNAITWSLTHDEAPHPAYEWSHEELETEFYIEEVKVMS